MQNDQLSLLKDNLELKMQLGVLKQKYDDIQGANCVLQGKYDKIKAQFVKQQEILQDQKSLIFSMQQERQTNKRQVQENKLVDPCQQSQQLYLNYLQYHSFSKLLVTIRDSIPEIFNFNSKELELSLKNLSRSIQRTNSNILAKVKIFISFKQSSNCIISNQQGVITTIQQKLIKLEDENKNITSNVQELNQKNNLSEKLIKKLICDLDTFQNKNISLQQNMNQYQKDEKALNNEIVQNIKQQTDLNVNFQKQADNQELQQQLIYLQNQVKIKQEQHNREKEILIKVIEKSIAYYQQ